MDRSTWNMSDPEHRTVCVKRGDLLPEWNRNVPYWNTLNRVDGKPDGHLHYSGDDNNYYDRVTDEELNVTEFQP